MKYPWVSGYRDLMRTLRRPEPRAAEVECPKCKDIEHVMEQWCGCFCCGNCDMTVTKAPGCELEAVVKRLFKN